MKSLCVIGGGLGGLITGALMAKEGYCVTVLEKNHTIGGGLQSFRRYGHSFDTGMHIFGGMGESGNLRRILQYIGIADKLQTIPCHETIMESGLHTTLPFGREKWIEAIGHGGHKVQLNDYVDALYRLADTESLYNLRPTLNTQPQSTSLLSAKEFISQYISDPDLQRRVAYITPLYGGTADTPALIHALVGVLHIEGCYTFAHPMQHMADLLAEVITTKGGQVLTDSEVTSIETEGRDVVAVSTRNATYHADSYTSAIPISKLIDTMPPTAFTPAFRNRIAEAPVSHSAFCVYVIPKGKTPLQTEGYYISRQDADPWNLVSDNEWPQNIFVQTYPSGTMTLMCPMDYTQVEPWNGSKPGMRPEGYRLWKNQMAQKVLKMAEEALGPIETDYIEAASPLTLRDYYGTTRGTCYGLHPSVLNPALTSLSPRTKFTNLYLTGQDVNFHGMVGVALTAIATAEAMVGVDTIVNKINEQQ